MQTGNFQLTSKIVGQPEMLVSTSFLSASIKTVSPGLTPVMDGFHANS
jgi:hypothetical protein